MTTTIPEELSELASQFANIRQSGKKTWFPKHIWMSVISVANKLPISEVSKALRISPNYIRKKMAEYGPVKAQEPLQFIEIQQQMSDAPLGITINLETASGDKMRIDGAISSHLLPIVNAFLAGRTLCCK